LVGKCNVFDLQGEYVFASYLMRVRMKHNSGLRPEYVVAYLGSSLGRLQIDAVSRQIAGMTNINAEEIRELLIPVPPRTVQDRICTRVADIRRKVAGLRQLAATELQAAKETIEHLIMREGVA
jgi:type I restriction enzyme S subunit